MTFVELQQLYLAAGGIGFVYIVGSALMGHLGEHGHGHGGHDGPGHAHTPGVHGHAGNHVQHITGGHSATLSHGHAHGTGHTTVHHGPGHGHAHAGHSHDHGAHGSHGNGHGETDNTGGRAASKAELATTFTSKAVSRDKSSTAFFSMMRFLNPMRLALISFLFGVSGIFILMAVPILGGISAVPALLIALFTSNVFLALLGRLIGRLERSDSFRKEDAIGLVGQLSVPIHAGATGEITFVAPSGKIAAPAKAVRPDIELRKLLKVIITDIRDGIYYVEEWNEDEGVVVHYPQTQDA